VLHQCSRSRPGISAAGDASAAWSSRARAPASGGLTRRLAGRDRPRPATRRTFSRPVRGRRRGADRGHRGGVDGRRGADRGRPAGSIGRATRGVGRRCARPPRGRRGPLGSLVTARLAIHPGAEAGRRCAEAVVAARTAINRGGERLRRAASRLGAAPRGARGAATMRAGSAPIPSTPRLPGSGSRVELVQANAELVSSVAQGLFDDLPVNSWYALMLSAFSLDGPDGLVLAAARGRRGSRADGRGTVGGRPDGCRLGRGARSPRLTPSVPPREPRTVITGEARRVPEQREHGAQPTMRYCWAIPKSVVTIQ